WRGKYPELLNSGAVRFQVHDFFTPQPITDAAVFLLRVVLNDWPDAFTQSILLRLREAAAPHTQLVLADWVLPLACWVARREKRGRWGSRRSRWWRAQRRCSRTSARLYWMDLTMQVMFNGQERTLREMVALAASAGWKVMCVTKAPGSLF
ncbi:hypothetical protein B0H11DRAFT_2356772, partial [Mycena galericulata]